MTGLLALAVSLAGLTLGAVLGVRLLGLADPLDRLLAGGLLVAVQALLVSIVVGAVLDRYEPAALLAGTALWDGALALALRRRRPAAARGSVAAAGRAALRALSGWQRAAVALAAAALLWRVVLALVLPPFAYDSLAYHLTVVAQWVQEGTLGTNPYAACCSHYPSSAEALFAWPTVFLDHDALADTLQVPLALLGALAVVGLARWAGAGTGGAVMAGALFLLTPIVLTQANTAYNDVAVAGMLLTALYFTAKLLEASCFACGRSGGGCPRAPYALLAGAATGFTVGTKTSGMVVVCVLGLLVLGHLAVATWRRRLRLGRATVLAGVFLGATVAAGGWWYGRNWVDTGNPVWPFAVDPLGLGVFEGNATVDDYLTVPPGGERFWLVEIARSWYHDLVFFTRPDYSYEERDGGLGPLWSWLGWWALAWFAVDTFRRRPYVVLNLLLPLALVFAMLPYRWWARFTIYLAALGAIALVTLVARLRPGPWRIALVVAVIALALGGAARATWQLDPAGRGAKLTAIDVLDLAVHPGRERAVGTLFFPEFRWLAGAPADATVLVETEAPSIRFLYPLFGASLERRVVQLYPGDEPRLDELLPARGPAYLAVETGGAFDVWATQHPQRLEQALDDRGVSVYRVVPAA